MQSEWPNYRFMFLSAAFLLVFFAGVFIGTTPSVPIGYRAVSVIFGSLTASFGLAFAIVQMVASLKMAKPVDDEKKHDVDTRYLSSFH